MAGAPMKGNPTSHKDSHTDPLNLTPACEWPAESHQVFWGHAVGWTGAQFEGLPANC